jgi:hypothetical protein
LRRMPLAKAREMMESHQFPAWIHGTEGPGVDGLCRGHRQGSPHHR